jgi:hypothetical protein
MSPDLEKWIDEASKGLEPLAREKITKQITEHYQDAVFGYRSSGLNENEVHSRAIHDLGDSKQARRQYGKIFYTPNYINSIKLVNTQLGTSYWTSLILLITINLPLIFRIFFGDESNLYLNVLMLVLSVFSIFSFKIALGYKKLSLQKGTSIRNDFLSYDLGNIGYQFTWLAFSIQQMQPFLEKLFYKNNLSISNFLCITFFVLSISFTIASILHSVAKYAKHKKISI